MNKSWRLNKELHFSDIGWNILFKWRIIVSFLVIGIICSILVGNYMEGIIIGLFVGIIVCICGMYLNPKVNVLDNTKELYGIEKIGQVKVAPRKKRIGSGIDEWLYGKRFKNESSKSLINNIVLQCAKNDVKEIVVLGEIGCDMEAVFSEISVELQKKGITMTKYQQQFHDIENVKELLDKKNVIFVEKINEARHEDILKKTEVFSELGINIAGIILIKD